jgi:hypothetical protein
MRPIPGQRIWALLPQSERVAAIGAIIRALTEVIENERLEQDPADTPTAPGRGVPAAVDAQASPEEL